LFRPFPHRTAQLRRRAGLLQLMARDFMVATVAIHLSFYKVLRIPLPWGFLEQYAF